MVMGGDSCSKGCEFESQQHILVGHCFTFICCKNCNIVRKDENILKEAGVGPLKERIKEPFRTTQ